VMGRGWVMQGSRGEYLSDEGGSGFVMLFV